MKYTRSMLLAAGALFALSACNGNTPTNTMTQPEIDSTVTARTADMSAKMQRNNDSLINAAAMAKADSIINTRNAAVAKAGVATPANANTSDSKKTSAGHPKAGK